MRMLFKRLLAIYLFFLAPVASLLASSAPIAILDFELNDLTLNPNTSDELERTASIKPLLQETLERVYGYKIVEVDVKAQGSANKGFGYLFDQHDVAANLGREYGADWVVVGRVHKASFLFVYFKARVIQAKTGQLVGDLIVEVKGPQRKLTIKGVERLAEQISDAIRRACRFESDMPNRQRPPHDRLNGP